MPCVLVACATALVTAGAAVAQDAPATRPATRPAVEGKVLSPTLVQAMGQMMAEWAAESAAEGEEIEMPSSEELAAMAAAHEAFYVWPETERRFQAGQFDDDANAEKLRNNLETLERYEVSLPRVLRQMAEMHEAGTLTGAHLELASRLTAQAVKEVRTAMGDVTTRPAGSTLSFRIAPRRPEINESPLTEELVAGYIEHLTAHGPTSRPAEADYLWVEVSSELTGRLVTHEHRDKKYVLLSDREGETILAGTGWHILDARVGSDQFGQPSVLVRFDGRGAEKLSELSGANIGRHLAIVVDGKVHSAPIIRSAVSRQVQITGQFTQQEAAELAWALRVGMSERADAPTTRPAEEPTTRPADPETQPAREPRPAAAPAQKEWD